MKKENISCENSYITQVIQLEIFFIFISAWLFIPSLSLFGKKRIFNLIFKLVK